MNVAGRMRIVAAIALLGLVLAGCASHPRIGSTSAGGFYGDGQGTYRVGEPYEVKGVWYYPAVDYGYDKTGVASWYGGEFEGRLTANGEIFDLNRLTAANTTLPMPSIVQVTNLQNGRSLRLRVNDRGPFVDGRLIDVSRRAAQLLGFESQGTAPVEVKIVKDASIRVAEEAMHGGGQGDRMLVAEAGGAAPIAAAAGQSPIASPPPPMPPAALPPEAAQAPMPPAPAAPPYAAPPYVTSALPPSDRASRVIAGPVVDTRMPPSRVVAGPIDDTQTPPSPPRFAAASVAASGRIFVQAGAFSVPGDAQRVRSRVASLGSVLVMPASVNGIHVYRVRLGPVESVEQAHRLLQRVVSSGYPGARIVTD